LNYYNFKELWATRPKSFTKKNLLFRVPFKQSSDEQLLQKKFQKIATELSTLKDKASIEELDAVIDKHVKIKK
jgi:hypothetical protein